MRSVDEEALFGRIYATRSNARALRIVAACVLGVSLLTVPSPPTVGVAEALASDDRDTTAVTGELGEPTAVVFRGDHYDARQFLYTFFVELAAPGSSDSIFDLDLDVNAATVQGFNGEAAHDATLRFSKRHREILEFLSSVKSARASSRPNFEGVLKAAAISILKPTMPALFCDSSTFITTEKRGVLGSRWICQQPGDLGTKASSTSRISRYAMNQSCDPWQRCKNHGGTPSTSSTFRICALASRYLRTKSQPDIFRRAYLDPPEALISFSYEIEGRAEAPSMRLDPFGPLAPALLRELFAPEEEQR